MGSEEPFQHKSTSLRSLRSLLDIIALRLYRWVVLGQYKFDFNFLFNDIPQKDPYGTHSNSCGKSRQRSYRQRCYYESTAYVKSKNKLIVYTSCTVFLISKVVCI